jgi:hypothetical protein
MDEILNRKLFRHKAQIIHDKVQGLNLGGPPKSPFTLEGIQQAASRLGQTKFGQMYQASPLVDLLYDPKMSPGRNALEFFNPLRKVKGAYKLGKAGVGLAGKGIAALDRGYEKVATRIPKITGTALTAGGGYDILTGGKEIVEGIRDEDPSKVAGGAGDILFGSFLGGTGIKRFRTGKPLELTGKQNLGIFGATAGLEAGGIFGPKGAKAEERDLINSEIQAYEKEIGRSLTDEERKTATFNLKEIIKAEKAQPIASTKEDLKFATGTIDSIDVFKNVVNANTEAANNIKNNPGPRSDEEIAATLEKQDRQVIAGKDLKALADKQDATGNKDAKAFNKFYKEINELTGEGDNTSDLLMMKFAMGLLSGTTNQKGFAGFAEVLGKAGGEALDSAIVLASKEKERRADLAAAYLKNKEKNSFANITTDRTRYLVKDPNALGGQKVEERARFKDSGYDAVAVPVFDQETGQFYPQWQQAPYDPNSVEVKGDAKQLDERRAMLQSIAGSYKMASAVKQLPENVIGSPGKIKLIKEDVLQGLSGILKSEFTPSQYNGDIDKAVNEGILSRGIYGQDPKTGEFKLIMSGEQAIREKEKLIQDLVKKNTGLIGTPSSDELRKLTEAARIEVNFAYNYANTLKAEDRLTEKNLEDAKKVSSIFGFFKSPRKVKENFRQLEIDAADKFEKEVVRYQYAGGNNAYVEDNYSFMPFVAQYKFKKDQGQRQEILKKQREQILGGIKGYE